MLGHSTRALRRGVRQSSCSCTYLLPCYVPCQPPPHYSRTLPTSPPRNEESTTNIQCGAPERTRPYAWDAMRAAGWIFCVGVQPWCIRLQLGHVGLQPRLGEAAASRMLAGCRHMVAECRHRVAECHRVARCRCRVAGCGCRVAGCGCRVVGCRYIGLQGIGMPPSRTCAVRPSGSTNQPR